MIGSLRCPLRSESDRVAAPPRNDVMCQSRHFALRKTASLFDRLVGGGELRVEFQSGCLGGFNVDLEFELGGLDHRNLARLFALKDTIDRPWAIDASLRA
jgi:hypothetical protein